MAAQKNSQNEASWSDKHKTKEYFFCLPFMHSVYELTTSYLHHFHDSYPSSITFFGILVKIEHARKIKIQLTFNIIFIFFEN